MRHDSNVDKYGRYTVVVKGLEILMAIVYIALGIFVLWKSTEKFNIPERFILPLGLSLIAYGLFRAYRVYTKYIK
jgi:hypothetical protein